jgi:transposase
MRTITAIGLDLAKNIFFVHGVDGKGKTVLSRKLSRKQVTEFFVQLPPCIVGMEACASSLYWARIIEELGHEVRRMPAQYVVPYRFGNKTDATDAAAICEAMLRPGMRFIPNKSQAQVDIQAIHRIRAGYIAAKTAAINKIRGLLAENGLIIPQGSRHIKEKAAFILGDESNGLSGVMRRLLSGLYEYILELQDKVSQQDLLLSQISKSNEDCKRLQQIPGIGLVTSTLLLSLSGNIANFEKGRSFSAYLGLVPTEHSSGGKQRLGGITKRGNAYARTLLIHGARAMVSQLFMGRKPYNGGAMYNWLKRLVERRGVNKASVALANKNARIAWRMLTQKTDFQVSRLASAGI